MHASMTRPQAKQYVCMYVMGTREGVRNGVQCPVFVCACCLSAAVCVVSVVAEWK